MSFASNLGSAPHFSFAAADPENSSGGRHYDRGLYEYKDTWGNLKERSASMHNQIYAPPVPILEHSGNAVEKTK